MPSVDTLNIGGTNYDIAAKNLINLIYPVGSIYMSVNNVSPATFLGGTWTALKDRFLIGAGGSYAVNATGGEATHTLTTNEIPSHSHSYGEYYGTVGWSGSSHKNVLKINNTDNYTDTNNNGTMTTKTTGGGAAHNNMPPYLAVYMWKRTA